MLSGLVSTSGYAQTDSLMSARMAMEQKDYSRAVRLLSKAYDQTPGSTDVYPDYLEALMKAKDFKGAEQLVNKQTRYQRSALLQIDLGKIYLADRKEKKAAEQFDAALAGMNGDDMMIQQMAAAFTDAGRDDYALKTYERASELYRNPYIYSGPMARLYAKTGQTDKAVDALLNGAAGQPGGIEEVKATLLELLGDDPKKIQLAQKALVRRINQEPESIFYSELLTWVYTQKGDWDGALLQIQAIDERNHENGQRLLDFARAATREKQTGTALKSIAAVIEKGTANSLYATARMQQLNIEMQQLTDNPAFTRDDVAKLQQSYASFFLELPQYTGTTTLRDYATLEAQYNNNPEKAIALLKDALAQPGISREFSGYAKLQMGDYQILSGKVWEASLTYSQVDKAFREDMLGEEARFRNARLAYYRGDFVWAQGQLTVLKASTSELIANDALALSVLITENTPDSNMAPLLSYARADLLLFQNKDAAATALLDSISRVYPKHTLNDDMLMLRADIALKHRDYTAALGYLKNVYDVYGKDVLGDDAVFKTAEIYEHYLNKPDEAATFYEKLIIDYPGSTYIQTARQRLQKKNTGNSAL